MPQLFSESIIHLIGYFAILTIITGIAIYVVGRFRANSIQQEQNDPKTAEHLKYFRDLRERGKLSEEEFRIIKKQLSSLIIEEEKKNRRPVDFEPGSSEKDLDVILARIRSAERNRETGAEEYINEYNEETRVIGQSEEGDEDTVVGR